MTQEERNMICRVLRKETACGLMEASKVLDQLISQLKIRPRVIMDNPASPKLTITWKRKDGSEE